MPVEAHNVRKMVAEVEATSQCLRKYIRVRELSATHSLERMRRLRMLVEQEACKREASFDRIGIIAEMDTYRFRTGFDLEPLYTKLYNCEVASYSSGVVVVVICCCCSSHIN